MKLIVAVNNLGVIGRFDGKIPWKCKEDMKHFKNLTLTSDIREIPKLLCGRKTFETFPKKGLPFRELIVVSHLGLSLDEALKLNLDWVIGGGEIYKQTILFCDELHISLIDNNSEGDVFFEIPKNFKGKVFYYNFKEEDSLSS